LTLHDIAGVYLLQGKLSDALGAYQQALAIKEQVVGPETFSYAATLHEIATCHCQQGDLSKASELYRQTLAIRGRCRGTAKESYATTLRCVADVDRLLKQGLAEEEG
jgi:tetratricopeptide (TPR) repeat protein